MKSNCNLNSKQRRNVKQIYNKHKNDENCNEIFAEIASKSKNKLNYFNFLKNKDKDE